MMTMKKIFLPFALALHIPLCASVSAQMKIMPVGSVSLLGGQYFLDGDAASFNGKVSAFVSPLIRFSESHELVPVYSGSYNGTQNIQELAGGGVLTRQRQNHSISVKHIYSNGFDRFKPRIFYSMAFTRETKDEKWGKGLFDYNTFGIGFEAEHERHWGTITESYDFYKVSCPNYESLISQSQGALDAETFSELSANAGAATLDNANHKLAVGVVYYNMEPLEIKGGYDFTLRKYPEQAVVGTLGDFRSKKRTDAVHAFSAGVSRDIKPVVLALDGRMDYLSSNQNSYDASRTTYVDDYYSYLEFALAPSLNFLFKKGGGLAFQTQWSRRLYSGRFAQDLTGSYTGSKTKQTVWLTSISVRYPVIANLSARAAFSYQISSSNMKYEANYRYNYRANNYLFGVGWEF